MRRVLELTHLFDCQSRECICVHGERESVTLRGHEGESHLCVLPSGERVSGFGIESSRV